MLHNGSSLSGKERNRLFWNRGGVEFEDLSGLTGLDSPADGRAVSALDFDRDGWVDFAVVSANSPLLQLFRNRICEAFDVQHKALALRLVGANRSSESKAGVSNRDGYGAIVSVHAGDRVWTREVRTSGGLYSAHDPRLHFGLGDVERVDRVEIRWPSGVVQTLRDLPTNQTLTVEEPRDNS